MGRHLRDPRTADAGEQTVARRRLALLEQELGTGDGPPRVRPEDSGPSPAPLGVGADPPDLADQAAFAPGARHRAAALPAHARLTAAALDQLPSRGTGGERRVTAQHVTVVALLVAALVCGGSWWVLSGRPEQRVVAPVEQAAPDPAVPPAAGADPFGAAEPDSATAGKRVRRSRRRSRRAPGLSAPWSWTLPGGYGDRVW